MADQTARLGDREPTSASPGRVYDYLLGGTTWFEVDKKAAEAIVAMMPEARDAVHLNRTFLQRAVRTMVRQGVRQFIDIGAGLPTMYNTWDTARAIDPSARVVYVDNDPIVCDDARRILNSKRVDGVAYLQGDLHEPEAILDSPEARELIDFDEPIGHLHIALWHFIPPEDRPLELLWRYLDRSAPGSYVAISHITADDQPADVTQRLVQLYSSQVDNFYFRTRAEVEGLFEGLELIPPYAGADPGLEIAGRWDAEHPDDTDESGSWLWCGVGRKP